MGSSLNSVLVAATLLERTPPAPLSPSSKWKPELTKDIDNLDASVNIRAVLHLLNDDFDGCHNLAQTQEDNPYSCHLHAIVHRREPDYWNSKYWIARSSHSHMPVIYGPSSDASVAQAQKAAEKFVDQVESAVDSKKGIKEAEVKQWEEMTTLAEVLMEIEGEN